MYMKTFNQLFKLVRSQLLTSLSDESFTNSDSAKQSVWFSTEQSIGLVPDLTRQMRLKYIQ